MRLGREGHGVRGKVRKGGVRGVRAGLPGFFFLIVGLPGFIPCFLWALPHVEISLKFGSCVWESSRIVKTPKKLVNQQSFHGASMSMLQHQDSMQNINSKPPRARGSNERTWQQEPAWLDRQTAQSCFTITFTARVAGRLKHA